MSWQSHGIEQWSLGGMTVMIPVKACVSVMTRALARGVCAMALPSAHRNATGLHDMLEGITAQGVQLPMCGHAVLHVKRDDLCISRRVRSCAVTCGLKASSCPQVGMLCSMPGMMPFA
jgi:tRNA(Phe) wybutosine-synthesizing methylase Tyw3